MNSLVPGSWINANFNVWIGAPEDNRAWDYLYRARNFYAENSAGASEEQRNLAFQEILIAEGSDWNWWYGPEHHSANDRDFDELYRKHLSNVYQALGGTPPDYLAQPIAGVTARPSFTPQSAYIHPRITGEVVRYFEWMGAARYTADRRSGSMHGKQFLLDAVSGDRRALCLWPADFAESLNDQFEIVVNQSRESHGSVAARASIEAVVGSPNSMVRLLIDDDKVLASSKDPGEAAVALSRNFEFRVPLAWLAADVDKVSPNANVVTRLRLRFSVWQNRLPLDALPVEGWIELELLPEADLVGH